jgi:hypothetical protein
MYSAPKGAESQMNVQFYKYSILMERKQTRHLHHFHVNSLANVQTRRRDRNDGDEW